MLCLLLFEANPMQLGVQLGFSACCLLAMHLSEHRFISFAGTEAGQNQRLFYAGAAAAVLILGYHIFRVLAENRNQALLLHTERRNLMAVINNSSKAIFLLNSEGNTVLFNAAATTFARQYYGIALAAGENANLFVKPADSERFASSFKAALNGEISSFETEEKKEFNTVFMEVTIKPIHNRSKTTGHVLLLISDKTGRKTREQQIILDQARLNLLHNISAGSVGLPEEQIPEIAVRGLVEIFPGCKAVYGTTEQNGMFSYLAEAQSAGKVLSGTKQAVCLKDRPELLALFLYPEPVIIDILNEDSRFSGVADLLFPPDTVSAVCMPFARSGKEYGLLILASPKQVRWQATQISIITSVVEYLSLAMRDAAGERERRVYAEKLQTSLREKETLLGEIHHRVKNNMAVISGLLNMQSRFIDQPAARAALLECQNRIRSMALIHEKLYQNESFSKLEFNSYLRDLIANIQNAQPDNLRHIRMRFREDGDKFISIAGAVPCGLIMNELIANAYKHAFVGRDTGTIQVSFIQKTDYFIMAVEDDGIGYQPPANGKEVSLGFTLVNALAAQLKSVLEIQSDEQGSRFSIKFNDSALNQGNKAAKAVKA